MKITINRIDKAFKLEAINSRGIKAYTDGDPGIGGSDSAFRPMETLLLGLAGCSAIDVINILNRQRQQIDDFKMDVKGDRHEGIPSPFRKIDVYFKLKGDIEENKLKRALKLTQEKYCSVLFSLNKEIEINYHYSLNEEK